MSLHQAALSRAAQMRHVFQHNLAMVFAIINQVADSYRYVKIDTEFPGLVYQTIAHHRNLSPEQRYSVIKANVDNLRLIQLEITLSNRDSGDSMTWEFNFRGFDREIDSQDPSSIELLKLQGIDFLKNKTEGVDPDIFVELFWESKLLISMSDKTWLTFHGAYDLAFLIKIMSGQELPDDLQKFLYRITAYFGHDVFDVKHLIKSCNGLYGGLENVTKILKIERAIGLAHQAGSDSLLIWTVFNKMMNLFFKKGIEFRHARIICGVQEL